MIEPKEFDRHVLRHDPMPDTLSRRIAYLKTVIAFSPLSARRLEAMRQLQKLRSAGLGSSGA